MPHKLLLFSLLIFFSFFLTLTSSANCIPKYDEYIIEFVLNQDATGSYWKFVDQLKKTVMPNLVQSIQHSYPGSKFGLTTFGDWFEWTGSAGDECYTFYSGLSADGEKFIQRVRDVRMGSGGDRPETSLSGILLSITDSRMGWSKNNVSDDGTKRVVKVLAMATDAASHETGLMKHLPPPKGDGSDSCKNDAPTAEFVGKVLEEREVFFLGLISKEDAEKDWHKYFQRMSGAKGVVKSLDMVNPDELISIVMDGIEEIICIETTTTTKWTSNDESTTTTTNAGKNVTPVILGAAAGGVLLAAAAAGGAVWYSKQGAAPDAVDAEFEGEEAEDFEMDKEDVAIVEGFQ